MSRSARSMSFGVLLAALSAIPALAADSTETPARGRAEVGEDLKALTTEIREFLPNQAILRDAEKRATLGPKAIPAFKRLAALYDEFSAVSRGPALDPARVQLGSALRRLRTEPLLLAFGDQATIDRVAADAKSDDPAVARFAKTEQVFARFLTAADAEAQLKTVEELAAILKESGDDQAVDSAAAGFLRTPTASDAVAKRLTDVLAAAPGRQSQGAVRQVKSAETLRQFEGKPIEIAGVKPDGTPFSTTDWKGKVVLIDFWATWCGPCKAELPRIKALYKENHEKGFEILGVSNDYTRDALVKFIENDPELSWTQIFDADAAAQRSWHAETKKYGITGIPVMFLIDRQGVLRSVKAREELETLLPKLLAEPVAAAG